MAALSVERKMYAVLSEFLDTTSELSDALQRQDQISFQLYLNMRQESVNQLSEYRDALKKQCSELPSADGDLLRSILSGGEVPNDGSMKKLSEQVHKNRGLLDRAVQSDRVINQRLGGKKSFYSK